jgi:hypothetical protein
MHTDNYLIFSEIEDGEIKVYEDKLRKLFAFVGDGIYDFQYDLKQNHVWIEFHPDPSGRIELSDWNKVDNILKNYIDKYGETNGLEDYAISFRLDLYFNTEYSIGIY